MSRHLQAKQFDTEHEYESYKRESRKQSRDFRDKRKNKRDQWRSNED